jgi:hypothetical protein
VRQLAQPRTRMQEIKSVDYHLMYNSTLIYCAGLLDFWSLGCFRFTQLIILLSNVGTVVDEH